MDQTVMPLRAISLLWQHTDDVINLLLPLYITDDIFTVDGISNGPSTSHQGKDSITALVTHKSFLSPRVPPSNTHLNTHCLPPFAQKRQTWSYGRPSDFHCARLTSCVSFPMRTFGVSGSRSVCSVGLCGDNRQAQLLIYRSINGHGNHQQTDADERRGNEMKNGKSSGEVKEKGP